MPRALAHHMVRLFNERKLPWLIVTSTLIEGVNTVARNVVIVDNKIATRNLDSFTYGNIRGRSGRMFRHFVGKVIVFGEPPATNSKVVDIPAYSQGPNTPLSLLIQLPWNELTETSRDRLLPYFEQNLVGIEAIRAAIGVDPQYVVDVAKMLHDDPTGWSHRLSWTGLPKREQLLAVCELVYLLSGARGRKNGVSSGRQLATRLDLLRQHHGELGPLAKAQMSFSGMSPDEAVEDVLDFLRQWTSHSFPRLLMALQSIAEDVLSRYGLSVGNYSYYASVVEAQFRPAMLMTLEEYGLPAPLTMRIISYLPEIHDSDKLDELLNRLRNLPYIPSLSSFEREMLDDAVNGL